MNAIGKELTRDLQEKISMGLDLFKMGYIVKRNTRDLEVTIS